MLVVARFSGDEFDLDFADVSGFPGDEAGAVSGEQDGMSTEPAATLSPVAESGNVSESAGVPVVESSIPVTGPGECVVTPPSGSAPVRYPAFDPVAVILAGRRESAAVDTVSAMEEQEYRLDELVEYLCFRVADEEYALSIMAIKEIIKPREVTEVPRMPAFISGVISLRGVIIPIIDMRLRLSLPVHERTGRERILVLRSAAGLSGILVDEVIQVVRIHNSSIEAPPAILEGIDREFVMGLGRFDNRMLILLNLECILNLEIR